MIVVRNSDSKAIQVADRARLTKFEENNSFLLEMMTTITIEITERITVKSAEPIIDEIPGGDKATISRVSIFQAER